MDDYLAHETISEINKLKFAHKKTNQAICKILRIEYHENKIISQLKGFSIIFSLSKDTLFDFKYKYNSMIFIVDSPTQINDFGMFALLHEIGHTNRDSLFLGSTRKLFSSCICIFLIFQNSFWLVIGIFIILLINLPEVLLRNNETLKEINADIFSLSLIQKPQKGWAFLSEILSRNFNHSKFRLLFHDIIIKKRIEGEFGENLYRTFRVINLLDFFRSYNITMIKFLRPIFFFFAVYFLSICEVSVNFERNLVIALLIIVSEFIYNFIISITLNQLVKINLSKLSSIHN